MKKFTFFIIGVLVVILIGYMPVKYTYRGDLYYDSNRFIVVENLSATGFNWFKYNNENQGCYIDIKGEDIRNDFTQGISWGVNRYLVYGDKVEEGVFDSQEYDIYSCESWEIVYPIERFSTILPMPKNYICIFDLQNPLDAFKYWFFS